MKKKYQYWIIKTYNKKRKKVLYRTRSYKKCKDLYKHLMKESKKVTIPKNILNRGELISVNMELLLITDDPKLKKYSHINKTISNNNNEWLIIEARKFQEEERFYCYPEKKTIIYHDIVNFLKRKEEYCSVYLFFNKLIIDTPLKVEKAIVLKNTASAVFVYNKLLKEELKAVFLGKLNKEKRKILAEKIKKDVGIANVNLHNKKSIH